MDSSVYTGNYTVELGKVIKEFALECVHMPEGAMKSEITRTEVNRPGLQLAGFFDHFDPERIQVFGKVETTYLKKRSEQERSDSLDALLGRHPPAIIVTTSLEVFPEMLEAARRYDVPLLRTSWTSSEIMAALIAMLNVQLAPRVTRHGVLVEVYGEGVLLLGESGVGKSETAMELVKRGHRLIADDAVEIKRVSAKTLVGSAPEVIRHYIELRGIGVIDVRRIFGMGAVKETEKIDVVIMIENWDGKKLYDRLGMDTKTIDILGLSVPLIEMPIKPGRNLAIIIEVAAMNNRQKKMGYNTPLELNERITQMFNKQKSKDK